MQKLLFLMPALIAFSAFAENEQAVVNAGNSKITRSEMRALMNKVNLKRYGGSVRKANSAKGTFVLINAQKSASYSAITNALSKIDRTVKVQTKVVDGSGITIENIRDLIRKNGGAVGVAVIDEADKMPALLSATEEGWAIVNVGQLKTDKPEMPIFESRVRKEILRAFAFAAGGVYSSKGDPVMIPVRKASDLDKIAHEDFAIAMRQSFSLALPEQGLTPWVETTYLKACEEGWAPAPTNEYQKAVWDKVHALPSNPMKIEFDPKKGR